LDAGTTLATERLTLLFDTAYAKGTLVLEECAYGLPVICPDISGFGIAFLDFYHAAHVVDEPPEDSPEFQIILHTVEQDDPIGRVRYFAPDQHGVRNCAYIEIEPGIVEKHAPWLKPGDSYGHTFAVADPDDQCTSGS
jgi:hypothetical protein